MPLETASYINGLVTTNPASTDTVSQADDHIRLIKQVLKDTFPNLNGPVTATPAQLNAAVPAGFIGMWSGSIATIPSGWGLCDGSAGRPDLRDRFIVGAGSGYSPGATGGAASIALAVENLPSHSHTFSGVTSGFSNDHTHGFSATTAGAGAHTHTTASLYEIWNSDGSGENNTGGNGRSTGSNAINGVGDHSHSVSGTTGGASSNHTHTFSGATSSIGSGSAIENRPPYYALAFIIKL